MDKIIYIPLAIIYPYNLGWHSDSNESAPLLKQILAFQSSISNQWMDVEHIITARPFHPTPSFKVCQKTQAKHKLNVFLYKF